MPISEIRRYVAMAGDDEIRICPVEACMSPGMLKSRRSEFEDNFRGPSCVAMSAENDTYATSLEQAFLSDDEAGGASEDAISPLQRRAMWARRRLPVYQSMVNEPYANLNRRLAGPASPLAKLLRLLKEVLGPQQIRRQSRGKNWLEVEVTPDILLRLRGDFDLHQVNLLEQLADHLRAYILGGGEVPEQDGTSRDWEGGPD